MIGVDIDPVENGRSGNLPDLMGHALMQHHTRNTTLREILLAPTPRQNEAG